MPSEQLDKDTSVHQVPQGGRLHTTVSVHERLDHNRDVRDTLDARWRAHGDLREGASCDDHPHRGGRYDSGEDQSPSLGLPGP